jgi:tetratricopeptide (TPR) repeat protein
MNPPASSSGARELFAAAIAHHGAGRLEQAKELYRQLLDSEPGNAQALQLLGTIGLQQGDYRGAIDLIRRAIAVQPGQAEFHVNLGVALVAAGSAHEAIEEYRKAIALRPDLGAAHNHLGVALQSVSRLEEAVAAFQTAVGLLPKEARVHYNLACALEATRQLDGAIESYERALAIDPRLAEGWHNLATARLSRGRDEDAPAAVEALQRSLTLRPDHAQTLANLACAHRRNGDLVAAIDAARRALELKPDLVDGLTNLSLVLTDAEQFDEAMNVARRAIEIAPHLAATHLALAHALNAQERLSEAIAACETAIELEGDNAEAYNTLAGSLHLADRFDEAIVACRKALELRPDQAQGYGNLSVLMMESGNLSEAISICRRAITKGYGDPKMWKWNLAFTLLKAGEFEEGFALHEFRHHGTKPYVPPRTFPKPRWDGSDLTSRTILLHWEQGMGDTIQFIRYVPMVLQRGGRVILDCQQELLELLDGFPGVAELTCLSRPGAAQAAPAFDVECPLMSLPLVFRTTLQTVPASIPYLHADPARVQKWRSRVEALGKGPLNVGLVWAGNPGHKNNRRRSVPPSMLGPLARIPGVRLFSLQMAARKGPAVNAPAVAAEMGMIDWTAELKNFTDTAALLANLDLLISSDTSVAHIAGAMGRPVWMLIPACGDWRWLTERSDSPWYPTMRLFRQRQNGVWPPVIDEVAAAVADLAADMNGKRGA